MAHHSFAFAYFDHHAMTSCSCRVLALLLASALCNGFPDGLCVGNNASAWSRALIFNSSVHDCHPTYSDLFNEPLNGAAACAKLCCSTPACAAFMWTPNQVGPAGNCAAATGPCCWIKPSVNASRVTPCRGCVTAARANNVPDARLAQCLVPRIL